jgi:hypothetical protein
MQSTAKVTSSSRFKTRNQGNYSRYEHIASLKCIFLFETMWKEDLKKTSENIETASSSLCHTFDNALSLVQPSPLSVHHSKLYFNSAATRRRS